MFSISNVNAKKITITRIGSDDGQHYDKVKEEHGLLGWNHSLSCTGAGSTLCGWTVAPSFDNGITATEVEDWVLNEIDNSGNESGSVTYNNLVYVEWSTEADGKITIMMTDEL